MIIFFIGWYRIIFFVDFKVFVFVETKGIHLYPYYNSISWYLFIHIFRGLCLIMATSFCPSSSQILEVSCIFFFVYSILLVLPWSESHSSITRFEVDATNILYLGDAKSNIMINYINRVGKSIYADTVQIWDKKSGNVSDFTTHFTFIVDTPGLSSYGHGLAYFRAPVAFQTPRDSVGAFLGTFNITYADSFRNQMIVIEFDSFSNPQWDPPYEHVGINRNSISSCSYTFWNANLHRGDYGELLSISYIRFEDNSSDWKLVVGLSVPIGVLVFGGIVACVILRRRLRKPTHNSLETMTLTSMMKDFERGEGPKKISYKDLASATNNFSDDKKLGVGGFGCVYKGYLSKEGMAIAVKKNAQGSKQGINEYITEVKISCRLRHQNLVQLIGWCHDHSQYLLVYEFMPNGSLDSHPFGDKSPLEWDVRYKIVMGLASALLYLHEDWEQCVVHRDIKTSNILLDSGFSVKLGDFGLARLRDHKLGPQTTELAGTLGYMAPEYVTTGRAGKESDMYSFGVVALEIACGRKVTNSVDPNSYLGLVQWVWDLLGKGELLTGVDQKLNNKFDAKQVGHVMMVGLWSTHPYPSMRPSIRQAIQVLKFEGAIPNLQMKMPVAMTMYCPTSDAPEVNSKGASMSYTSIDLVR